MKHEWPVTSYQQVQHKTHCLHRPVKKPVGADEGIAFKSDGQIMYIAQDTYIVGNNGGIIKIDKIKTTCFDVYEKREKQ